MFADTYYFVIGSKRDFLNRYLLSIIISIQKDLRDAHSIP